MLLFCRLKIHKMTRANFTVLQADWTTVRLISSVRSDPTPDGYDRLTDFLTAAFSGIPWGAGPPPRPRSTSPPRPGGPRQRSGLRFEFNGPNGSRILLGSDIRNHRGEESDQSPNISGRPPPLSECVASLLG